MIHVKRNFKDEPDEKTISFVCCNDFKRTGWGGAPKWRSDMAMAIEAAVMGTNFSHDQKQRFGGFAMKFVIGVLGLSILAAIVGVFAASELHDMATGANDSSAVHRASATDPTQPSQKIQQWVNH